MGIHHGVAIDSAPIAGLALPLGVFGTQQIGDRRQAGIVAIADDAQALSRMPDATAACSVSIDCCAYGPHGMRLAHLHSDLLAILVQSRIRSSLRRLLWPQLGVPGHRVEIDFNLHTRYPVRASAPSEGVAVIFPVTVGIHVGPEPEPDCADCRFLRLVRLIHRIQILAAFGCCHLILLQIAVRKDARFERRQWRRS